LVPDTKGFTIAEKEFHEQKTVVPGRWLRPDRRLRALAPVPPSCHPGHEDVAWHDRGTGGSADVVAGAVWHHRLATGRLSCGPLGRSDRRTPGPRLSHRRRGLVRTVNLVRESVDGTPHHGHWSCNALGPRRADRQREFRGYQVSRRRHGHHEYGGPNRHSGQPAGFLAPCRRTGMAGAGLGVPGLHLRRGDRMLPVLSGSDTPAR